MTLHIGIASYQNPDAIDRAIKSIQATTEGPWKLLIVDNASPDPAVRRILEAAMGDSRITVEFRDDNIGYVGAVNRIIRWADDEGADYVAYCDNDAEIRTPGWNTKMLDVLSRHHEVAMACPTQFCAFPIRRSPYTSVLWGLGCFWMLKRPTLLQPPKDIGPWDESLGHQEEVDYQLRLHLEGWSVAGVDIDVYHQAKASSTPEAQARITAGVIAFYNKWLRALAGPLVTYHSPNVLRFEDWPVPRLHIEKYLQHMQEKGLYPTNLNDHPREVVVEGRKFELILTPRWPNLYRDRII